jgi:UDP-glucose 6-dehydrogenase
MVLPATLELFRPLPVKASQHQTSLYKWYTNLSTNVKYPFMLRTILILEMIKLHSYTATSLYYANIMGKICKQVIK